MEKEFIPYEQALALKELGFDEPCMAQWNDSNGFDGFGGNYRNSYFTYPDQVAAPLYQQAFRWFRENHYLYVEINVDTYSKPPMLYLEIKEFEKYTFIIKHYYRIGHSTNSYEESELECLKKLIEIVKEK